jgi:hypothetical protein
MLPLRPMTGAMRSFWNRGQRTERAAYVVGALLIVSGLIHLAIVVISGASWTGPLSLRKPTTFGLSFRPDAHHDRVGRIVPAPQRPRSRDPARYVHGGLRAGDRADHAAGLAGRAISLQHGNDV